MRLGEECPFITPCGFCSRQLKPCEKKKQPVTLDLAPVAEALKGVDEAAKEWEKKMVKGMMGGLTNG